MFRTRSVLRCQRRLVLVLFTKCGLTVAISIPVQYFFNDLTTEEPGKRLDPASEDNRSLGLPARVILVLELARCVPLLGIAREPIVLRSLLRANSVEKDKPCQRRNTSHNEKGGDINGCASVMLQQHDSKAHRSRQGHCCDSRHLRQDCHSKGERFPSCHVFLLQSDQR